MKYPLTAGYGRKLLLFVIVDAVVAAMQTMLQHCSLASFAGLILLRSPYSVVLAAILNATEKKGGTGAGPPSL
jgi:hypothetical protein